MILGRAYKSHFKGFYENTLLVADVYDVGFCRHSPNELVSGICICGTF